MKIEIKNEICELMEERAQEKGFKDLAEYINHLLEMQVSSDSYV